MALDKLCPVEASLNTDEKQGRPLALLMRRRGLTSRYIRWSTLAPLLLLALHYFSTISCLNTHVED